MRFWQKDKIQPVSKPRNQSTMIFEDPATLPPPPQEWLDAIEEEEKMLITAPCCGARPWKGEFCACKPMKRKTRCSHCKEIGHSKKTCPQLVTSQKITTQWNRAHKLETFRKYRCTACGMCGGSLYNNSNLTRHQRNKKCLQILG